MCVSVVITDNKIISFDVSLKNLEKNISIIVFLRRTRRFFEKVSEGSTQNFLLNSQENTSDDALF